MRFLTHVEAAELLFAAGVVPAHPQDAVDLVVEQLLKHGGDRAHFADEIAAEYGDHPEVAAAHMCRCLRAVPEVVEVPDWPERGPDGHLYTGMVDEA